MSQYFDYNATTPLDKQVAQEISEHLFSFGNPSSTHHFGKMAKEKMDHARKQAADLIGASSTNIFFTSGGTEGNNMILKGWLQSFSASPGHIITSCIEHPSILNVCNYFEENGFEVTYLPVNELGYVEPKHVELAIQENTQLISIMSANNEIGTIQAISEISSIANQRDIFFHTDAVQAIGKFPLDVKELNVHALTFSAHKFNGPKGIGAVYLKNPSDIFPLIIGGGQEQELRNGTENMIGIIGLGKACEVTKNELEWQREHCQILKQSLIEKLKEIPDCFVNGDVDSQRTLPNTLNIRLNNIRGEAIAAILNEQYRIAVSLGSACSATKKNLSHVLLSIGLNEDEIRSSIRISFGKYTTEEDIHFFVNALTNTVSNLRRFLPTEVQGVN
ncbi:cysteine desulfurase family protein [Chengkuizengella axinellae]|uniref:cysteine desulfurase n=1 Tax=Chengkuizengella axinellae TaxID=3064388 RepID=A0ABT9ITZ9_9BACL|nr:cysteine desulfurase family protein [Chengkuizengella sp. 2205SS18-9]MDP5272824.1 cysteine desulfurase family protein [Chengkuizengella sp. 2205SS18-9]